MNRKLHHPVSSQRQRGAALVIALIMLIMVSLVAAGGFMLTTTEARGAAGWSDRQRALFTAEGALAEGVAAAKTLLANQSTTTESSIPQLVRAQTNGYYVRADGNVPALDPWPTGNSITASSKDDSLSGKVHYLIVYEGSGASSGTALVTGNGNTSKSAVQPRFTIYAHSGGLKDGTNVVLSTTTAF